MNKQITVKDIEMLFRNTAHIAVYSLDSVSIDDLYIMLDDIMIMLNDQYNGNFSQLLDFQLIVDDVVFVEDNLIGIRTEQTLDEFKDLLINMLMNYYLDRTEVWDEILETINNYD